MDGWMDKQTNKASKKNDVSSTCTSQMKLGGYCGGTRSCSTMPMYIWDRHLNSQVTRHELACEGVLNGLRDTGVGGKVL